MRMVNRFFRKNVLALLPFGMAALLLTTLLVNHLLLACDVPVFRYALERWQATVYEAVVLHEGPLTEEQKKLVEQLEQHSVTDDYRTNIYVRTVDLVEIAQEEAEEKKARAEEESKKPPDSESDAETSSEADRPRSPFLTMHESIGSPKEPTIVLVYPMRGPGNYIFWSGPLNETNVGRVKNSPLREKIAERIIGGDNAVWVVLESGNQEADDQAEKTLKDSIEGFKTAYREMFEAYEEVAVSEEEEETLEENPAVEEAVEEAEEDPIRFSVVRLSRDDEKEAVLIDLLMHTEPDLEEYADQPMALPVFGRGRSLYALVGDGINEENVSEACAFLLGPCSCTIKDANPGIDLVVDYPWDEELAKQEMESMGVEEEFDQPLVGLSTLSEAAVAEEESEQSSAEESESAETVEAAVEEESAPEETEIEENASAQADEEAEPTEPSPEESPETTLPVEESPAEESTTAEADAEETVSEDELFGANPFANGEERSGEADSAEVESSPAVDGEELVDSEDEESGGMSPLSRNILFALAGTVLMVVIASAVMVSRGRKQ